MYAKGWGTRGEAGGNGNEKGRSEVGGGIQQTRGGGGGERNLCE